MNKLTAVLISNTSFREITLSGLDIKPLLNDQRFDVDKPEQLSHLISKTYPKSLSMKLLDIDSDTNDDTLVDTSNDIAGGATGDINNDNSEDIKKDILEASISTLELSTSVEKSLVASGVNTLADLVAMTEQDVIDVKGIANAGLAEIKEALAAIELSLKGADE